MEDKLQKIIELLEQCVQQNAEGLQLSRTARSEYRLRETVSHAENESWKAELRAEWRVDALTHELFSCIDALRAIRGKPKESSQ